MPMVCPDCLTEVDAQQESCASCGFVRPHEGWTPDPLTGLILGGRYRLEGRLGAGGMASVFRASRIGALGGVVAVKVLAPRFARTVIARRFEREAQVVARLTNPHVVRIYDFDSFSFAQKGGGPSPSLYYIAMELIEGQTLGQLLRSQGKVNFLWGIDVLRQLARGLEEAHAQGIVHRDLKPSNVILVQQRGSTHIKILDFGIAAFSAREEVQGQEKLTQTGFVSGTPDYMAPEQAVGDPNVGPPADMFAIGVLAFEMFAGRKPFEGATMESLLARVTKGAPSLREVMTDPSFPPELYRIVDKLLERDPKLRYQNAAALLDDLGRFPTLQTTPDFVPPKELLERYATGTSHEAYSSELIPAVPGMGGGIDTPQGSPTLSGRSRVSTTPAERPEARRKKSTLWLWLIVLLVLGGAATAVVLVVMQTPPRPEPPTTIAAASDASASDASASDTSASDASVAGPDASTVTLPATPFIDGERTALEDGFIETRLPVGDLLVAIAEPVVAGPLYRPLALRLALDRGGKALRLVKGSAAVVLARDGREIGKVDGIGRLADGRLALELPPRPVPDRYRITFDLEIGGGEKVPLVLVHDAVRGGFSVP